MVARDKLRFSLMRRGMKMKKIAATLLCGVMLTSFVLCGCQKPVETDDGNENEIQTEAGYEKPEAGDTTQATTTTALVQINDDNLKKVVDLYNSKVPDGSHVVPVYLDGIRGEGSYSADEDLVYFDYSTMKGDSDISLNIHTDTKQISVTFQLGYGETRYYGNTSVGFDSVESLIDTLIDNPRAYELYDDSAIAANEDNIKKDLPIIYSRLITVADKAFPELGLGLEDIGIDLGDKYRSLDPTQVISTETEVKNEHKFVNGICSDCGMCWTEYYYDAIGKLDNDEANTGWRSLYGQDSATMMSPGDYIQCSASNKESGDVFYHFIDTKKENRESITCRIYCRKAKKGVDTSIRMNYEQKMFSVGQGIVDYKYNYWLEIKADAGDYAKVFESKESFKKYAEVILFVTGDDGVGRSVWGSKKDADLKKEFEEDGCIYMTKDEAIDFFWDHHQGILASMDSGMIWLDTSLADMGVNWKKKDN